MHSLFIKQGMCGPQAGWHVPGFLKLFLCGRRYVCLCMCVCVCVCVCVSLRLLITRDVIWCDIDPYNWLNKLYGFYRAVAITIISEHGLSIHMYHGKLAQ